MTQATGDTGEPILRAAIVRASLKTNILIHDSYFSTFVILIAILNLSIGEHMCGLATAKLELEIIFRICVPAMGALEGPTLLLHRSSVLVRLMPCSFSHTLPLYALSGRHKGCKYIIEIRTVVLTYSE